MSGFQLLSLLLPLLGGLGYINHRYIRLPETLGLTVLAMLTSLALVLLGWANPSVQAQANAFVQSIDFAELVLHGILGPLLFAGALQVDLAGLQKQKRQILLLATVSVLLSTGLIGGLLHLALGIMALSPGLLWCFVFGALISPTDPVVVLNILKKAGVPLELENTIVGESLFNDGAAVLLFATLVGLASGQTTEVSAMGLAWGLCWSLVGGVVLGYALGSGVTKMLKQCNSYTLEILLTLALATGGYALCHVAGVSGPIGVVVMGLTVAHKHTQDDVSGKTREHLRDFWELLDELLNMVLFALLGLQTLVLTLQWSYLWAGLGAAALVLAARYVSVKLPMLLAYQSWKQANTLACILTWGGLRGGISVALALALPMFDGRDLLLGMTYTVVALSLLVQAPTLETFIKKTVRP